MCIHSYMAVGVAGWVWLCDDITETNELSFLFMSSRWGHYVQKDVINCVGGVDCTTRPVGDNTCCVSKKRITKVPYRLL